jgi:hypothetical protein
MLELCRAETTTSASHLEDHLQAVPVEQFQESHNTLSSQPLSYQSDSGPRQYPDDTSSDADADTQVRR